MSVNERDTGDDRMLLQVMHMTEAAGPVCTAAVMRLGECYWIKNQTFLI